MNDSKAIADRYQKQYVDLRFERGGLFELIQERYQPEEVLYPGCSIHITPAFFFPHVVFVDQDPAATEFFSSHEMVLALVKRHRSYRRAPHIQFISQDFTRPLPVPEDQFDLLLALFAGGVSKACRPYLKMGGLLLTNNHQNDAVEAARDDELALIATIERRQGKYRLVEKESDEILNSSGHAGRSKRYLRKTNGGVEYIENERYYLFKRTRSR